MKNIITSELEVIVSNEDAVLVDIGDGIGCIEFKSKGNSITPLVRDFIENVIDNDMYGLNGLVIGNQSKNFSVGANLFSMKKSIDDRDFESFNKKVKNFQRMTSKIKFSKKPIVAAPYKMTLGGGLEVALHCHQRVALDKSFFGLVEVGVGLIPGGGGTKESALIIGNATEEVKDEVIIETFNKLIQRSVSKNADDAKKLNYIKDFDTIIADKEMLIDIAKQKCMELIKSGFKPLAEQTVTLPGKEAYKKMVLHAEQLLGEGKITQYDYEISKVIANVLAGSTVVNNVQLTETELLEIEREGFVYLTQQQGTYERISHFIETGELLRN
nr:enoyl-CoA hydratase-related protein [Sedimentibacter sp.]